VLCQAPAKEERTGAIQMTFCGICGKEAQGSYELFGFMPCCQECFERVILKQKMKEEEEKKMEKAK